MGRKKKTEKDQSRETRTQRTQTLLQEKLDIAEQLTALTGQKGHIDYETAYQNQFRTLGLPPEKVEDALFLYAVLDLKIDPAHQIITSSLYQGDDTLNALEELHARFKLKEITLVKVATTLTLDEIKALSKTLKISKETDITEIIEERLKTKERQERGRGLNRGLQQLAGSDGASQASTTPTDGEENLDNLDDNVLFLGSEEEEEAKAKHEQQEHQAREQQQLQAAFKQRLERQLQIDASILEEEGVILLQEPEHVQTAYEGLCGSQLTCHLPAQVKLALARNQELCELAADLSEKWSTKEDISCIATDLYGLSLKYPGMIEVITTKLLEADEYDSYKDFIKAATKQYAKNQVLAEQRQEQERLAQEKILLQQKAEAERLLAEQQEQQAREQQQKSEQRATVTITPQPHKEEHEAQTTQQPQPTIAERIAALNKATPVESKPKSLVSCGKAVADRRRAFEELAQRTH